MKKLKLAPCTLAFSLATISLTSCGYNNFSYVIDASEDEFAAEGKIAYGLLKNYKLIELKLLNGENKLYIVSKQSVTEGVYLNSTVHITKIFLLGKQFMILAMKINVWN